MSKSQLAIKRILIANRGEIAVRIMKTAREMGIETVAIYTKAEEGALHLEKADIKVLMTGSSIDETYLNAELIVRLALQYKVDAIHPGYGFLSENEAFSQLCRDKGIVFIGPAPEQIKWMGNKDEANKIADACKVPILKKINGSVEQMLQEAQSLSLPLLIKAAAGGGGKGMRVVYDMKNLESELKVAAAEAYRYFGNASVYIEQYVHHIRHIEVQILADTHGNIIHLNERECSLQRRHQKVIEEAPAPNLSTSLKNSILKDALTMARHIGYTNAGTVEFMVTPDQKHYFLEMNTRIQVEHPVTEEITGVDIVREQIRIAAGLPLSFVQEDIQAEGHAIEARIYAEDPRNNFMPSFGHIIDTYYPNHPNIRIDAGAQLQENLNPNFDSLLIKVIAKGKDRIEAMGRLKDFLTEYALFGIQSNREIILEVLSEPDFIKGTYSTSFFQTKQEALLQEVALSDSVREALSAAFVVLKNYHKNKASDVWNSLGYWRWPQQHQIYIHGKSTQVDVNTFFTDSMDIVVDGQKDIHISDIIFEPKKLSCLINNVLFEVKYAEAKNGVFYMQHQGVQLELSDIPPRTKRNLEGDNGGNIKTIMAPMPGLIIDIMVQEGARVKKGNPLLVLEAMKTENVIHAFKDTIVTKISVVKGQQVSLNQLLIETE